jgi:hypothetical protein
LPVAADFKTINISAVGSVTIPTAPHGSNLAAQMQIEMITNCSCSQGGQLNEDLMVGKTVMQTTPKFSIWY